MTDKQTPKTIKKPERKPMDDRIQIRLSQTHKAELQVLAIERGLTSSTLLRMWILQAIRKDKDLKNAQTQAANT